ncbi:hypothetical protein J4Q44_G00221170, partial [Coregonus suidteri]
PLSYQRLTKAICVLHNFMDQEGTCSSPPCARGEVCCSAGCFKDGGQQRSAGGEGAVQARGPTMANSYISCVGEPLPHLNWLHIGHSMIRGVF